jgi:hypothetical protein
MAPVDNGLPQLLQNLASPLFFAPQSEQNTATGCATEATEAPQPVQNVAPATIPAPHFEQVVARACPY